MMIKRQIEDELLKAVSEYPVVTILGPRQAGKTTLAKTALADFEYCNLESPEMRQFAELDPKAFLNQFKKPVILDEIQRVPNLLSYIQVIVDERKQNGQFVLTGSHQLQLRESITQSLAGRTAILQLLPLSIQELQNSNQGLNKFEDYAIQGFLPRIYDQKIRPHQAYSNYYQTYVERDVRQLINLKDMTLFEKFIKLLAGRVGQLMDYNSLANDIGVDSKTVKSWLSILEASFIVYKLTPYFENFGKRVIKAPKYYFIDIGLLSFILGLEKTEHVSRDPLVGQLFENLVIIEFLKSRLNKGKISNLYFYRDSSGLEVDLLIQNGRKLNGIEIKSASTFSSNLISNLKKLCDLKKLDRSILIYNGESRTLAQNLEALKFDDLKNIEP